MMRRYGYSARQSEPMAFKVLLATVLVALLSPHAFAYRPFDSSDADVAAATELELELGFRYFTEHDDRLLQVPVVANYGMGADREIVLEGVVSRTPGSQDDDGTSVEDAALLLKQIHRSGSLQGGAGISIATEMGALLPSTSGDDDFGVTFALITSRRWQAVTLHATATVAIDRHECWEQSLAAILEGPHAWVVRPVAEVTFAWQEHESPARAALVGLIWRAKEVLSFDIAVRHSIGRNLDGWEIRAGLTWTR